MQKWGLKAFEKSPSVVDKNLKKVPDINNKKSNPIDSEDKERINKIKKEVSEIESAKINESIKELMDKNMFISEKGTVQMKDKASEKFDKTKTCDSTYKMMFLLERGTSELNKDALTSEEVKKFDNIMNNLSIDGQKKASLLFEEIYSMSEDKKTTRFDLTNISQLYEKTTKDASVSAVGMLNMEHEYKLAIISNYLKYIKEDKTKEAKEMLNELKAIKDFAELQDQLDKIKFFTYTKNVSTPLIKTMEFKSENNKKYKEELLNMYKDINYMKNNVKEAIECYNSTVKRFKGYDKVLTQGIRLVNELFKDKIKTN